jgi:hypothetical protein
VLGGEGRRIHSPPCPARSSRPVLLAETAGSPAGGGPTRGAGPVATAGRLLLASVAGGTSLSRRRTTPEPAAAGAAVGKEDAVLGACCARSAAAVAEESRRRGRGDGEGCSRGGCSQERAPGSSAGGGGSGRAPGGAARDGHRSRRSGGCSPRRAGMVCTSSRSSRHCTPLLLRRRPRAAGLARPAEPGAPRRIPPAYSIPHRGPSGRGAGLRRGLASAVAAARRTTESADGVSADTVSAVADCPLVNGLSAGSADTCGLSVGGLSAGSGGDMVGTRAGRKWGGAPDTRLGHDGVGRRSSVGSSVDVRRPSVGKGRNLNHFRE